MSLLSLHESSPRQSLAVGGTEGDTEVEMEEITFGVVQEKSNLESNVQDETPTTYDFTSIPKSMYQRAGAQRPPEEPVRGPTSVNDMIQLKLATRERLRQQRWKKQREKGRIDMFTNPQKYIAPSSGNVDMKLEEVASEEKLFLESFCAATRKPDLVDKRGASVPGRPNFSVSPRKGPTSPSHNNPSNTTIPSPVKHDTTGQAGADHSPHTTSIPPPTKKKKNVVKFIPPTPKPLPVISRPKSTAKPPPDVFLLPTQQMPSPRMLASSPRLFAAMTFFQKETIDEFGYSSFSDNDEEDVDSGHVQMAKQLERETRRQRREEAEYRNYLKFMESASTEELQIKVPSKHSKDSWQRAKKAHEKIVPKESQADTIKFSAMKEEWQKLEIEKKNNEVTMIARGTGKYILEAMFGKDKKQGRKKKRVLKKAENLDEVNAQHTGGEVKETADVFIPLDAFKDHKYGTPKVDTVSDLVEVVSLPASFQGSTTPPPSPRSLHALNSAVGKKKKKKKKKKNMKQIEEEQTKLRQNNEKYMKQRKLDREKLMLDFSTLNKKVQPRVR